MTSNSGLVGSSVIPNLAFNWVFLVEISLIIIVSLFFLFYFNRVFAALISYGIRWWTWRRYRVYFDIQSLQISLLAGRIFFKGLRYHGNNETILIQNGFVTWRYWLRKVREANITKSKSGPTHTKRVSSDSDQDGSIQDQDPAEAEDGGADGINKLPCRLTLTIDGAEWFIYNRSAAYDSILAGLSQDAEFVGTATDADQLESLYPIITSKEQIKEKGSANLADPSSASFTQDEPRPHSSSQKEKERREVGSRDGMNPLKQSNDAGELEQAIKAAQNSLYLQFLPISIECGKAAVVMGNENTKSILIVKVEAATGEIDASPCHGPDQYRQLMNFDLTHPVVEIKPNCDYKEDQSTTAIRMKQEADRADRTEEVTHSHSWPHRFQRKTWHRIQYLIPYFRTSVESLSSSTAGQIGRDAPGQEPNQFHWQGLSRYLEDSEVDDHARWSATEYAFVPTILDSPFASVSYFWDIPGKVQSDRSDADQQGSHFDINGDEPPAWGLDLFVRGAMINYGPWADRQRGDLQRVFFPTLCKNAVPAATLKPGQQRLATKFTVYVQLDNETTLRVPIREESKNWKWPAPAENVVERPSGQKQRREKTTRRKKGDKGTPGPEKRPFGWLDIKVAANATISYSMDMYASSTGFSNKLDIDIPNTEITSSINHGLLWRSVDQRLSCDLSNPLQWNGLHTWKFDITSNGLELFILREHIFLLIDLVDDWSSGPPPDYLTFAPFQYLPKLSFGDFRMYLNANDSNIINSPADFDDNTYLILFGTALVADLLIPIDKFRPHQNEVTFDIKAHTGGLNLHVPPWNTQATFLTSTELARLKDLVVGGRYQYCATTSTDNTDTLMLNVGGRAFEVQLFGFFIRYILRLKENYFGDDIRFKTLEEYQQILHQKENPSENINDSPPHKKSNDLDVILTVAANDVRALLPANLYCAKKGIKLDLADLSADLRFTNYYMDMQLCLSPIGLALRNDDADDPEMTTSSSQLFIDGVDVFGHRVFGLPPSEPTYVCNWNFTVGAVTGECSADFLSKLVAGGKAFEFSFDDDENALPSISTPPLHDVTFLRATVKPVRIWAHVDDSAFLFSTGAISANFDDWAGSHYSKKLRANIPDLRIACVDGESASRHRTRSHQSVDTQAYLQTTVVLTMIDRKLKFAEDRQLQQQHIRREDFRTNRTEFLLLPHLNDTLIGDDPQIDSPAMCFPPMPLPIDGPGDQAALFESSSTYSSQRRLKRKSSFLSVSTMSIPNGKSPSRRGGVPGGQELRESRGDSHSRSRQENLHPLTGSRPRDVSASTGRHSSFYSAFGDPNDRSAIPPSSSTTLASQYLAPYFPLETVEPNPKDVPVPSAKGGGSSVLEVGDAGLKDIDPLAYSEKEKHSSFIVEFEGGLSFYLDSRATTAVTGLLRMIQPVSPDDILDEIHVGAISEIFAIQENKLGSGKSVDINVRIPSVNGRLTNAAGLSTRNMSEIEMDQYDLSVLGITATMRNRFAADEIESQTRRREHLLLHFQMLSADLSAKERLNTSSEPTAAVECRIRSVLFWLSSQESLSAQLNIKSVVVASKSSNVEYLATLLHRTNLLASTTADTFSTLISEQKNRLQLFTFLVATQGQNTIDPLFMTKPAYVLRSASDHLRSHDTWKVVARLRHMFTSLEKEKQLDIASRALNVAEIAPKSTAKQVLAVFDQWRSWDLANVTECVAMKRLFGTSHVVKKPIISVERRVYLAGEIGLIAVRLDPSPKQNEISITRTATKLTSMSSISDDDASPLTELRPIQTTTLQIRSSRASVTMNWELCELIEGIAAIYSPAVSRPSTPSSSSSSSSSSSDNETDVQALDDQPREAQVFHAICVIEDGYAIVDTINLHAITHSQSLRLSSILAKDAEDGTSVSFAISAEAVGSEIRSHYQVLTNFELKHPTVYTSVDLLNADNSSVSSIKSAANCAELSFLVKQDPLIFLETVDLVIGDEIAQIYELSRKVKKHRSEDSKPVEQISTKPPSRPRVQVALFLDRYTISLPLLQNLTYKISGNIARTSVSARDNSEMIFDFDLKENSHEIQTHIDRRSHSISLLQMPSTNGRVTGVVGVGENVLSVFASVEPIQFDAAAVHSLLTALNRPEIANAVKEIQDVIKIIQKHLQEIFGEPATITTPPDEAGAIFIYDAHLTFAGLHIFADTSAGRDSKNAARLSFDIGCVQVEAANRLESSGPVLPYPEVHLRLRQIRFDLSRICEAGLESCGNFAFAAYITAGYKKTIDGDDIRSYHVKSDALEINLFAETASTVVNVMGHLQDRIKDLDLSREMQYLQRIRKSRPRITIQDTEDDGKSNSGSTTLFGSMYSLELLNIQVSWIVGIGSPAKNRNETENLVLSFRKIDLSTKKENSATLAIEDFQLQMVPSSQDKNQRSPNSALLPEVVFNVAYVSMSNARRLAFQAKGKSLDLRLTSRFMIPAADLQKSIESAAQMVSAATSSWTKSSVSDEPKSSAPVTPFFGKKRMESLLVDANFAGAVVHLRGSKTDSQTAGLGSRQFRQPQSGKYGQFSQDGPSSSTILRAPGLAFKIEFKDNGIDDPSLNAEVKVDASANTIYPTVVPLVMEISSSMKEIIRDDAEDEIRAKQIKLSPQKLVGSEEDNLLIVDPSAVLGRTHLNLGIRICSQEFKLSCQPIARVDAVARFDDIYLTMNNVQSAEHGHFFAASAAFTHLQASVQHVYSRESTASFDVDSIVLSLMNSKHVSGISGMSALLKISPMKVLINAKQLQDFLLFRDIWVPPEIRQSSVPVSSTPVAQSQSFSVSRYQQVAATGAFPWNATVSIAELDVQLDLGQAIGKSTFAISNFWISSRKNSDWEQNLCLGFEKVGIDSTGRMSGYVSLQDFKVRTSIKWPDREKALNQTPLVQASLGFSQFRVKAAFDYQVFLIADITTFEFIMYNVRNSGVAAGDRLVAILDGDSVQVFCTTATASQSLALYQAFQRLIQEKKASYAASLNEIERFMKRKSIVQLHGVVPAIPSKKLRNEKKAFQSPISLHTDVVVILKAVNIGAFPGTFFDPQVFKLEALNAQARFAVTMDGGRIYSALSLTLGQLRIGLAGVKQPSIPKSSGELSVEEVVDSATGSRGGTILKVPKVTATMQTWQTPGSTHIDYKFKSAFEGKVEVGWNYSRISYIRHMYETHSKTLAQRLGKPLPPSAVRITGVPDEDDEQRKDGEQQKITAEVNVPQSRYDYRALETPVIETPQLRDMGEATPPLEWIGLHRDRLPNLTHQILIVTLLEVASEVEDAYAKILGSS